MTAQATEQAALTPARLLQAIAERLRTAPPAGVDAAYVEGFLARNRERLLKELEPSLYNRYRHRGAPERGRRGYKPPADACPEDSARLLLQNARTALEEPAFAWAWRAATGGGSSGDDEDFGEGEEERAEQQDAFLDMVGVPEVLCGRRLSGRQQLHVGLWFTDLAMLTHPEMHAGGWSGGEMYLRLASTGAPLPVWLAEALGGDALQKDDALRLVNVEIDRACAFIAQHHSQLPTCNRRGVMYSIGVQRGGRLAAVATAGSPTGRWSGERVDPRDVLELTRVASDGTVKGAASKLVARLLDLLPGSGRGGGPTLFVTYQLAGEAGTPYRALREKGLRPVARLRGRAPGGARAGSTDALAEVDKIRWEAGAAALPADWGLLTGREA